MAEITGSEMEGGSVPESGADRSERRDGWLEKIEHRQPIVLDAFQIDQMAASLGHCISAIYEVIEAMESEDHLRLRRERLRSANKSIEEAATLLDKFTDELIK